MDIVFSFLGLYVLLRVSDHFLAAKGYHGPLSDHFDGEVFYSYGKKSESHAVDHSQKKVWKWLFTRKRFGWVWRENRLSARPEARILGARLVVTFVNHATLLIQTDGMNILTDPVWSRRVSPFTFVGPSRFRAPGVSFDDLPEIDLVLISHNHYDHMDLATLRRIAKRWDPTIVVPLGNGEYLRDRGFANVREMDWWDEDEYGSVRIVSAPGQHFSSRALSDRNNTLWSGYVIETAHGDIYFAGDTGYGEFVKRIRERYDMFRLALLPIGAFRPEGFMGPVHISPEQAVMISDELRAKTTIGIHHGTFHLADDGQDEPNERIDAIRSEREGTDFDFRVPENGAVYEVE